MRALSWLSNYLQTALLEERPSLPERLISAAEERHIKVVALVPKEFVEGQRPITVPVEITAKHRRVREILLDEGRRMAAEDEFQDEISEALRRLRGRAED